MIDLEKTGKRIALLRKERGYTGEALAEQLQVSPQAISKWENARCLPETAILPALAEALDCSIDSLLCPREFFVLEAVYTNGETHIPVTHFINDMVRDNVLSIYVNEPFLGISLVGERLKMLTIKYQTPKGIFFSYVLQNDSIVLDKESVYFAGDQPFQIIDAYYGNEKEFHSAMQKMKHYEYFNWNQIPVNHQTFPSSTASDDTEYLTLIYLNSDGIHVISCPENETIYYANHRTRLLLKNNSKCILKDIMRLSWGKGIECSWVGALYAALRYMGETYTYHQLMGMSGVCWRTCFTDVWDYSCTDALVAFDYVTPLFENLGYSFHMVDRVEKHERKTERLAVMKDIQNGKPVLAINLRVAPEWGVITGYIENGCRFLCRTYFDKEIFDDLEQETCENQEGRQVVFEDNEGYLFNDFWPFLLLHFGEKKNIPSSLEILKTSLSILIASFHAKKNCDYYQGKDAYKAWMKGLSRESDFQIASDKDNVLRRLCVNDSMLCSLIDARCAAVSYLHENITLMPESGQEYLKKIVINCQTISDMISEFRNKINHSSACNITYNTTNAFGVSTPKMRKEQIDLLEKALILDEENCRLAQLILEIPEMKGISRK